MKADVSFVLTCEHAGFRVPSLLKSKVNYSQKTLSSHRGWDFGALELAEKLKLNLNASLFFFPICRLLIDGNRRLNNQKNLFGNKQLFTVKEKSYLKQEYLNYRKSILDHVENEIKYKTVVVLSIHSFTPVFKGERRSTDIGLCFRPKVSKEKQLALFVKNHLSKMSSLKVHLNRPYKGTSDCFLNDISDLYLKNPKFVNLFLEINQKHLKKEKDFDKIQSLLLSSFLNF